jgi:hypothetical protein
VPEREPTRCRFCSPRRRSPLPCPHFVGRYEDFEASPQGLPINVDDPRIALLADDIFGVWDISLRLVEELGGHSVRRTFDTGGWGSSSWTSLYVPDREAFAQRLNKEIDRAAAT